MHLNEYQVASRGTAGYPNQGYNLIYPALGLAGEAGETVDKIKKLWRNKGFVAGIQLDQDERMSIIKEMGDVLWYLAALATELGVGLDEVATTNLDKLQDRQARGVIKSEGDNR